MWRVVGVNVLHRFKNIGGDRNLADMLARPVLRDVLVTLLGRLGCTVCKRSAT